MVPVNLVYTHTHVTHTHTHTRLTLRTGSGSPPRLPSCSSFSQWEAPLRTATPQNPIPPSAPCTSSPPPLTPPSTHFRTLERICVTHVDSGLRRSQRESRVWTQSSLFLIFVSFLFRWAGEGRSPGSCFVFSFSGFTRHGADDDYYYYYYYSNYHYINYCYLHSQYICWAPERERESSTNIL